MLATAVRVCEVQTPRRGRVELHYRLVSMLIAAGPEGLPLYAIGRGLWPERRGQAIIASARQLVDSAAMALPISTTAGGCVCLDLVAYTDWLGRAYQIPVSPR